MAASAASSVFFVCSQCVLSSSPVDWRDRGGRAQEDMSSSGQCVRRERGRWMKTRSLDNISFENLWERQVVGTLGAAVARRTESHPVLRSCQRHLAFPEASAISS